MQPALDLPFPFDFPEVRLGQLAWQAARQKAAGRGDQYVTGYLGEIVVATTFNLPFRPVEDFAHFDFEAPDGHTIDVKTYSWAADEYMARYPGQLVRADLIALVGFRDRSYSSGRVQKLIRPCHWGYGDFQYTTIEPDLAWAFAPLGRRPRPLIAFSRGPNELRHERNMRDTKVASKKQQQVLSDLNWPECLVAQAQERRREIELLAGEMSLDELKSINSLGYDLDPVVLEEVIAAKARGHESPKRPASHSTMSVRETLGTDGVWQITLACGCGWQHPDVLTNRADVRNIFAAHQATPGA